MDYVKSPINFTGGKYKLLNKIIPLFPENIDTFYDIFCGAGNVGINVNAKEIICIDSDKRILNILQSLKDMNDHYFILKVESIINDFSLSKENKEGYIALKSYLAEEKTESGYPDPVGIYVLSCYSFSNMIRFNKKGIFNAPFAGDREFNISMRNRVIKFYQKQKEKNIKYIHGSFQDMEKGLSINEILRMKKKNIFFYFDPPYLGSDAPYNENGLWDEYSDGELLKFIDILNGCGFKFALSNNFAYKNPQLREWSKKYNIHYLGSQYNNCNYQKKNRKDDIEVLITNY